MYSDSGSLCQLNFFKKNLLPKNLLTVLLWVVNITLVWAEQAPKIEKSSLATAVADYYIPSFYTIAQAQKEAIIKEATEESAAHQARPAKLDVATSVRLFSIRYWLKVSNLHSNKNIWKLFSMNTLGMI